MSSAVAKQVDNEKPPNWKPVEKRYDMKDSELRSMVRVPKISSQRSGLLIGSLKYSQSVQIIQNKEFRDKAKKEPKSITKIVEKQLKLKPNTKK